MRLLQNPPGALSQYESLGKRLPCTSPSHLERGIQGSRPTGLLQRLSARHREKCCVSVCCRPITADTGVHSSQSLLYTTSHKYLLSTYHVHTLLDVVKRYAHLSIGLKKRPTASIPFLYENAASRSQPVLTILMNRIMDK